MLNTYAHVDAKLQLFVPGYLLFAVMGKRKGAYATHFVEILKDGKTFLKCKECQDFEYLKNPTRARVHFEKECKGIDRNPPPKPSVGYDLCTTNTSEHIVIRLDLKRPAAGEPLMFEYVEGCLTERKEQQSRRLKNRDRHKCKGVI